MVLPREMSLEEIKYIKENSNMELEVFVHGALCICYSGQCLMSSLIGGRSGNRGRCAQPCRLPYKLIDLETREEIVNRKGKYLLSPRDLNTIENLDKLIEIGIESLKIEGRMKRPEYVAVVVHAYKMAVEQYVKTGKINVEKNIKKDLEKIFNRKFTKGYLFGESGQDLMSFEKPGNRGVELGKVVDVSRKNNRIKIKLMDDLRKGDGIKVKTDNGNEDFGTKINKIYKGNKILEKANVGEIIEIDFKGKVNKGDIVFKSSDTELLNKAASSYETKDKKIPLYGEIKCKLGENLTVYIWDDDGHYIEFVGGQKVEKAIKRPLTKERLLEQINKLGNTPYYFETLKAEIDDNVSIQISEINKVRREAIQKLSESRKKYNNRKKIEFDIRGSEKIKGKKFKSNERKISLRAYVNNLEQLKAALNCDVDLIYYSNLRNLDEAIKLARKGNKLLVPALDRITNFEDMTYIRQNLKNILKNSYVLVSNHGQLKLLKDKDIKLYTDFSFNIFNSKALEQISELDVECCTLSPELTLEQIKDIVNNSNINCEIIVYGHLPMMITEYCVIRSLDKISNKTCSICQNKKYGLKDRYGVIFPLLTDNKCRMQILNSKKLFLLEYVNELIDNDLGIMRLQFTNEGKNEIINIIKTYKKVIDCAIKGQKIISEEIIELIEKYKANDDYTKGHYFRGVI